MPLPRSLLLRRGLPLIPALAVSLTLGGLARAQSSQNKAAADALFDEARKAMDAGNFATACPKFEDSQKLDPGVGTLLNLARCYDLSGKTSSAYSTYREAASMARAQGQEDREAFARGEVKRLEPKLTRLTVQVPEELRAVSGLSIAHGGQALPDSMWGVAMAVDPGTQVVEASAPGYEAIRLEILAKGEGKTFELAVPALKPASSTEGAAAVPAAAAPTAATEEEERPPAASQAAEPAPAAPTESAAGSGPGIAPWLLGGAGVVALGVGTAFAVMGLSQNDKAKAICVNVAVCPGSQVSDWWDAHDAAKTDFTIAYVGWGVGGAAVVASAVWLIAGRKEDSTGRLRVHPWVVGRDFGIVAGGQF